MTRPAPLVAAEGISKRFTGTQALDEVSFTLARGEVHALIGENGAGKSTLIKILGGVHAPDAGTLAIAGVPAAFASPRAALAAAAPCNSPSSGFDCPALPAPPRRGGGGRWQRERRVADGPA